MFFFLLPSINSTETSSRNNLRLLGGARGFLRCDTKLRGLWSSIKLADDIRVVPYNLGCDHSKSLQDDYPLGFLYQLRSMGLKERARFGSWS